MRVALVNPPWRFEHSIYFGCREPHLPLELGYAQALLERDGHAVADARRASVRTSTSGRLADEVAAFRPDMTRGDDRAELSVLALRAARTARAARDAGGARAGAAA